MKRKPDLEQGIFNPVTGRNITGDVASASRENLVAEIDSIIEGALLQIDQEVSPASILEDCAGRIDDAVASHFSSIKQPVDRDFLGRQLLLLEKLICVYKELLAIGMLAEGQGLSFEVSSKPKLSFNFGWDCRERPLFITLGSSGKKGMLLAVPLSGMKTDTFGPFYVGGTPPAAQLVRVTSNALVFASLECLPPKGFLDKIKTPKMPCSEVIPCVSAVRQGPLLDVSLNDPACVSCEASPGREEILNTVKKRMAEVKIVGFNTSGSSVKELILLE